MWRSNDPDEDREALKAIARLAVDFADVNGIPAEVLYGEGPTDGAGLIPLLTEVFFLGRACGARAVITTVTETELPEPRLGMPMRLGLRKLSDDERRVH